MQGQAFVHAESLAAGQDSLGNVLHHGVRGNVNILGKGLVENAVQRVDHAGSAHAPVEDGARSVGGGVGAGDQLSQGLGRKLFAAQFVAGAVLSFHETRQEIDTGVVGHDFGAQALVDPGHSDAGQVLDGLHAVLEEAVGDVLGEGNERREAAQRGRHLTAAVQHFDGLDIGRRRVGGLAHLGDVLALLEHAERSSEGQVTDDVEGQVVEPIERVDGRIPGLRVCLQVGNAVPLLHEQLNVAVDILFELANGLHTEGMRHGLALARMFRPVARVEQSTADGDKGIIEVPTQRQLVSIGHFRLQLAALGARTGDIRLEETVSVPIDHRNGRIIRNGDIPRGETDQFSILLVGFVHGEKAMALSRLQHQPEVGEAGHAGGRNVM